MNNNLWFQLDHDSRTPLYRQISEHIRSAIFEGKLVAGDPLPTVRDLAKLIGISHVTAFRAYEDLREGKFIKSYGRNGIRIATAVQRDLVTVQLSQVAEGGSIAEFEVKASAAGIRSLATSVSDVRLFRDDELMPYLIPTTRQGSWLFYFSEAAGLLSLRSSIAALLTADGLNTSPADILVTSGSMDSIARLAKGAILVQEPARLGLRNLLEGQGCHVHPIRSMGGIIDLEHAEAVRLTSGARMLYCAPDFGHATGEQMPLQARQELVTWANMQGVELIEDASCHLLRLSGDALPSLASMSADVVNVGSFSYSLAPGLRCGYIRMPSSRAAPLLATAEALGNPVSSFIQKALASYLQAGGLQKHLARVLPIYQERRRTLFDALRDLPDGVSITTSKGGFSTWCALPEPRATELFHLCLAHGVAIAPGPLFCVLGDSERNFRLSYGSLDNAAIKRSAHAIVQVLRSM